MKKFLIYPLILCAVLFLCGFGCDGMANARWGVWVENKSDKDVHFVVGLDLIDGRYYPTTQLPNDSTKGRWPVKAGQRNPIDYSVQAVNCTKGTPIAIFVIDTDTMAKYTWNQLRENENFLKRFEFTCDNIPRFGVIYP